MISAAAADRGAAGSRGTDCDPKMWHGWWGITSSKKWGRLIPANPLTSITLKPYRSAHHLHHFIHIKKLKNKINTNARAASQQLVHAGPPPRDISGMWHVHKRCFTNNYLATIDQKHTTSSEVAECTYTPSKLHVKINPRSPSNNTRDAGTV